MFLYHIMEYQIQGAHLLHQQQEQEMACGHLVCTQSRKIPIISNRVNEKLYIQWHLLDSMIFPFQGQMFIYVVHHHPAQILRISVISPIQILESACLVRLIQIVPLISLIQMEYKSARPNVRVPVCINNFLTTLLVYI